MVTLCLDRVGSKLLMLGCSTPAGRHLVLHAALEKLDQRLQCKRGGGMAHAERKYIHKVGDEAALQRLVAAVLRLAVAAVT